MIPVAMAEDTVRRVRAEFLEMPGLKLTVPQAQRLWGVDRSTCEAVINTLTATHFLVRTRDGAVVLRSATTT
jgi:Fic family protein